MAHVVISHGMANHLLGKANIKLTCECGLRIPKYRGRYPVKCPSCSKSLFTVAQDSVTEYYERLCETFLTQRPQVTASHELTKLGVKADLLRFAAHPLLMELQKFGLEQELVESLYFINFPKNLVPTKNIVRMYETALRTFKKDVSWAFVGAKAVGLYPELVITEEGLSETVRTARKLKISYPTWLPHLVEDDDLSEARQREIIVESYGYARQYLSHEESVEFSEQTLICEGMWLAQTIPSSVLNPRKSGDHRRAIGGFRFKGKGEERKDKIDKLRLKIISKKNRSGGLATNLTSVRKILQRKKAQKKATAWHKNSPQSPRLHKSLGTLLHRSKGMYQPTSEGYSQMRHIKEAENSLRLFSDGTPYTSGRIFFFEMKNPSKVLESRIRSGSVYTLRRDITSVGSKKWPATRVSQGTRIKIESLTAADFPNLVVRQWVIEAEVLTGSNRGSFAEFDGGDLSIALGIDETVRLTSSPIAREYLHGGAFIQTGPSGIEEVVLAGFDYLLSEGQVGAIIREVSREMRMNFSHQAALRVYNDAPSYKSLSREIIVSSLTEGHRIRVQKENYTLFESESEEVQKIVDRSASARDELKTEIGQKIRVVQKDNPENKLDQVDQLNTELSQKLDKSKEEEEAAIAALGEQVSSGGEGGTRLEKAVFGYTNENPDEVVKLLPGTRISNRKTSTGKSEVLVLSGPYQSRIIVLREGYQKVFSPDWGQVHALYKRIL